MDTIMANKIFKSIKFFPHNKKSFNRAIVILQRKLKTSYVIGYPYKMTLDVSNICPLRCVLCPTGQGKKTRRRGLMKFSTFKKVIDEAGDYLYYINLFSWGEPFCNKEVFDIIKYAKQKKIRTILGSTLPPFFNDQMAEELVKSGLDELWVSLDGDSQKTTQIYQVGIKFDSVIENMKKIVRAKKKFNSSLPFIQWRYIIMKHNEHEIEKAKELAKEIGIDKLELAKNRGDMGDEIFENNKTHFEKTKDWLPENEKYSLYNYNAKTKKKLLKNDCSWLWAHSMVHWNGSVSPCELIYDEKYDFGNVLNSSFKKIWNNEFYTAARKKIGKNKRSELNTVCYACHDNQEME